MCWLGNSCSALSTLFCVFPCVPQVKRTNLKKPSSERTGHGLRVKFNPLALLLDASLEGEFDLVQRIIYEVSDYVVVLIKFVSIHISNCQCLITVCRFKIKSGQVYFYDTVSQRASKTYISNGSKSKHRYYALQPSKFLWRHLCRGNSKRDYLSDIWDCN